MAVTDIAIRLSAQTAGLLGGLRSSSTAVGQFGTVAKESLAPISEITKKIAFGFIGLGTSIGGALAYSTKAAAPFDAAMRNVNSILKESEEGYKSLSRQILLTATQGTKGAEDLAAGAYQIVSSGFSSAAESTLILDAAAKAASAGMTETETAVTAITTALNSYGLGAEDAAYVSDLLFNTVDKGVITFEQLSVNLGDFIGMAKASGAGLDETLGALANITTALGNPARSATALQGIFRSFIKETPEMSAVVEELGYASASAMLQQEGLQDSLNMLNEAIGGDKSAMAKLFADTEGLSGVFALTSGNTERMAETLATFTDKAAVAGTTERALQEQSKSLSFQWEKLKNTFGAAAIQIGSAMLPALGALTTMVGSVIRAFVELPNWMKTTIGYMMVLGTLVFTAAGVYMLLAGRIRMVVAAYRLMTESRVGAFLIDYIKQSRLAGTVSTILSAKITVLRAAMQGMSGAMAGVAGGVAIGIGALYAFEQVIESSVAKGVPEIERLTESIENLNRTAQVTGSLETMFGANLEGLSQALDSGDTGWIQSLYDFDAGTAKEIETARQNLDRLDKTMAEMVRSGNAEGAAEMMDRMREAVASQGGDMENLDETMNDYGVSLEDTEGGTRNLTDATGDAIPTVEELEALLAGGTGPDLYAKRLEALTSSVKTFTSLGSLQSSLASDFADEQAKAADAAQEAADTTKAAQEDARRETDFAADAIERQANDFERALDAAEKVADAEEQIADAVDNIRDAEDKVTEALEDQERVRRRASLDRRKAQKELDRLKYVSGGMAAPGSDTAFDIEELEMKVADTFDDENDAAEAVLDARSGVIDAQNKLQDEQNELVKINRDIMRENADAVKDNAKANADNAQAIQDSAEARREANAEEAEYVLNAADISKGLEKKLEDLENFEGNLLGLADKGVPLEVLDEIRSMGEEGVELAEVLANAAPAEFDKIKGLLAEKARVEGELYAKEMDRQLVAAAAVARLGAEATVREIIEEMEKIAPGIDAQTEDVLAAAERLGITISTGFRNGLGGIFDQLNSLFGTAAEPTGLAAVFQSLNGMFSGGSAQATTRTGAEAVDAFMNTGMQSGTPAGASRSTNVSNVTAQTSYNFGDIFAADLDATQRQAAARQRQTNLVGMQ